MVNPTVVKHLKGTAKSSLLFKNADQRQLCQNLVKNIFDLPRAVILRKEIILANLSKSEISVADMRKGNLKKSLKVSVEMITSKKINC